MNRQEARDQMMEHVRQAALLANDLHVLWPDTPQSIPTGAAWARPTIRHATGRQNSLSDEGGRRSFMDAGVLMVQLFAPVGDGQTESDFLTNTFLEYFRGIRSSQIWYRNIRAMEIGKDGASEQVNFLAEFQYDSIS